MSKFQARAALDQLVGRPVLVSQEYASAGLGTNSEVTSGSMMADIRELAKVKGTIPPKVHEANCAAIASAYNFDISGNDKPFMFADGFALIPIHGLLINRFNWSWSFVTGYNFLRNQLIAAMADDDVKNIIFDVNSPGGMVSGCQETADMIFEARASEGGKPLIAVVDANCHSAAYYLASQCDHIAITPTGNAANIGAYRIHMDVSEMMSQAGVAVSFIQAGAHKVDGNPFEPLSDEVRAEFQADIDAIYDVFVAAVARGRGLDEQAVRDTEARCYGAADALALGLVDAIQNPSDAVESYLASCMDGDDEDDANPGDDTDVDPPQPQETNMTTPATAVNRTKPAAGTAAPAATATTTTEVTSVDTDAVSAEARTAERARISGIQGHAEAQGRTALASHLALNTDLSVEAAAGILAASPKDPPATPAATTTTATTTTEETNHFRNAMNNSEQPNVGAGGGTGTGQDGDMTPAQRILATQARAGGFPKTATTH